MSERKGEGSGAGDINSELQALAGLAETPYEIKLVRVEYMLLGYLRALQWQLDVLSAPIGHKSFNVGDACALLPKDEPSE